MRVPCEAPSLVRRCAGMSLADDAAAHRVVDVVIDVGDAVSEMDDAPLGRCRLAAARVADNAAPHLARQIEIFEQIHKPQALLVVAEALRTDLIECALSCMAEGRVPQVMAERNRFGKILVEAERPRNRPRDLRDFERVRQPGAVVVALGRNENLRFVGQAAERLAVQNAVPVALKAGAVRTGRDFPLAARAFVRKGRPRRENVVLPRFKLFAYGHNISSPLVEKVHLGDAAAVARQRAFETAITVIASKPGACTSVLIPLEGESFRMGTFGRLVFCASQNTDCRKNEVFRQS